MVKKINEFVDEYNNIIKGDDVKSLSGVEAKKTTDYNTKISRQNFSPYFLGRFGFYFFENENIDTDEFIEFLKVLKDDIIVFFEENKLNKLKDGLEQYVIELEKASKNVIEENLLGKVDKREFVDKNDNEFVKIKELVDILTNLNKRELEILTKVIESKINE